MIERAEWRRPTNAPRTPLGAFVGRDLARGVPVSWSIFLCALLYGLIRGTLDLLLAKSWADWIGFASSVPLLVLFAVLVDPLRRAPLAPDPAPGPTFHASISLARGGKNTGDDAGMVAFVDGWLLFEGAQTSFALQSKDLEGVRRSDKERTLSLVDDQRVSIKVFVRWEMFRNEFESWCAMRASTGLSRLPPLLPGPERPLRAAASLQALSALLPGIVLGVLLPGCATGRPSTYALPTMFWVVIVSAGFALLARLLAWDRRRRDAAVF